MLSKPERFTSDMELRLEHRMRFKCGSLYSRSLMFLVIFSKIIVSYNFSFLAAEPAIDPETDTVLIFRRTGDLRWFAKEEYGDKRWFRAIAVYNSISDTRKLYAGQKIYLPSRETFLRVFSGPFFAREDLLRLRELDKQIETMSAEIEDLKDSITQMKASREQIRARIAQLRQTTERELEFLEMQRAAIRQKQSSGRDYSDALMDLRERAQIVSEKKKELEILQDAQDTL